MKLSARNQFPGKVLGVEKGAVNSIVRIEALGGNTISATISNMAARSLVSSPVWMRSRLSKLRQ